jgi:hypothetical protein
VLSVAAVAPILEPLKPTKAWALLSAPQRARVIWCLRSGRPAVHIEEVFEEAALGRGEDPAPGELWLWSSPIPTNGLLRRDRCGLWRVLQFNPLSTAHESWHTWEGRA